LLVRRVLPLKFARFGIILRVMSVVLATSLFGDAAAALREHRSAALDEHCWSCAALTES
jgi:hypothetical protein